MYCPNCSAKNEIEQKFCRACGLNLKSITNSLLDQLETSKNISSQKISNFFEVLGKIGFGGLLASGFAGIVFLLAAILNKFILSGQTDKILVGLVLFTLIISAVFGLVYVIFREYLKETKKNIVQPMKNEIEGQKTNKLLEEKRIEPFFAVTEETTDFLRVEAKPKISGELF